MDAIFQLKHSYFLEEDYIFTLIEKTQGKLHDILALLNLIFTSAFDSKMLDIKTNGAYF